MLTPLHGRTMQHLATMRFAAVVESSEDAIISETLDGTIETWNQAAERLFGYTAAEAVGKVIDIISPSDRREEDDEVRSRLREGGKVNHFETVAITKSGTLVPISLSMSPIVASGGQVVGFSRIARDISRQKTLEREALRLAAIVDTSEDAIVSKDLNGVVQTWNRAAERMFGYSADEMIGRPIHVIIPHGRRSEEDSVLERIRAGKSVEHFETIRQRKDGALIEISLSVSPILTAEGTVIGASKIARDISEQRRLARDAEEANRLKDEFLATLSHELRTPLNAVLGYTRMLRMGQFGTEGNEGHQRAMEIIERNANVVSQLVSDVLDVSTIVTGKIRLKPSPADLVAVVLAAVDVVRPSAEAKGVALRVETPDSPMPAVCDAARLQQVFWNLLTNALKFTPRGGSVDIRAAVADRLGVVTVTDTGIGLRPESIPYLFQRFWQAESVTSRETGGLGLGLALARHFVELHGGTIRASSAGEGKGSSFTVAVPLSDVTPAQSTSSAFA
jgi:PAS domain S-box-containing protein